MLAKGRAHGRRWIGFASLDLQFDDCLNLLGHSRNSYTQRAGTGAPDKGRATCDGSI
jgi:hypothetical protein